MALFLLASQRAYSKRANGSVLSCLKKRTAFLAATVLVGVASTGVVSLGSIAIDAAHAQTVRQNDPNAQLLLKADQLIYDNDAQLVTALGNVQLDYDGYNVVAQRVSYNQKTRRVKASGNVEILEPDGNRVYADEIDLTDDFSDGFVNALRVETPDNTRFAAESAERFEGQRTVFNNGVYTACEPCRERPEKAPIWQIKAQKVILNGVEKTITYRNASFELFGQPIAFLPYFSHADGSVKRKSGFLAPKVGYKSELGYFYSQSYFLVTGDSHDLTFNATGFTKQGIFGQARWRQQLENGQYEIRVAGINQQEPDAFDNAPDNTEELRAMVSTRGNFTINPRWTFGWDVLAQTDKNFSRTYEIDDYNSYNITNKIYLRGLNDRSYFDLSAYEFRIQTETIVSQASAFQDEDQQPLVLPSLDYNYVTTEPNTGGEVSLDVNSTVLFRNRLNQIVPASGDVRTHGIDGTTSRISADLQWKKSLTTAGGLTFTPSLSLRGDAYNVDGEPSTPLIVDQGNETRFMPTAGLQVGYPLLIRAGASSHVVEPIAQVLVRPSLQYDGVLPNEDAQSLVFDGTTLFQHDKFSGYDRLEGGTRTNVGVRYSGVFESGLSLTGLVGQSIHLAGRNPYAREDDLVNAGEESGLETDRSDYVASMSALFPRGFQLGTQGRFDENSLAVRRAELAMTLARQQYALAVNYTFIDEQPDYGFPRDRQQVGFSAKYQFADNWTVFGGVQYDLESDILVNDRIGLRYHDECFTFSLAFSESRNQSDERSRSISFNIGLRTIGDFQTTIDDDELQSFNDGSIFSEDG